MTTPSWYKVANFEGHGGDYKSFEAGMKDLWGADNGGTKEAAYLASEGAKIAAYKSKSADNSYWYEQAVSADRRGDWQVFESEVKAGWAADGGDVNTLRTKFEADQKVSLQTRLTTEADAFYARQAATEAALQLSNREEMTEEHAKWLVDPNCALLPSDDPLSCSRDAPFVVGSGDDVRVLKNEATRSIVSTLYADVASQKVALNNVRSKVNKVVNQVNSQIREKDPGAWMSSFIVPAFRKDKDRLDRKFDGKIFPKGTDMVKTKHDIRTNNTLAIFADIALGFVPIYGEMVLGEVLADLACNKINTAADGPADTCEGSDWMVQHTTAAGWTAIADDFVEDKFQHAMTLDDYWTGATVRNEARITNAAASDDLNEKERIMSEFEVDHHNQYTKLTQLWNAWNPAMWKKTNPKQKHLVADGNRNAWGTDYSAEINNLQSFIQEGSMKGCDPTKDDMCAAAVWQWCEKHPEFKWVCDNPDFHHETWMKDEMKKNGSWFPYDDFVPAVDDTQSNYFDISPVLESNADAILGL
jgi:hypothetical protein